MATASDVVFRGIEQRLDAYLATRRVPESTRSMLVATIENARAYFEYCEKAGKDPADRLALAGFLAKKTVLVGAMSQTEAGLCYAATAGFAIDVWTASRYSGTVPILRNPVVAFATVGIAVLDLLEIGNACSAVQEAWYDLFLNTRTPVAELRRQVRSTPLTPRLP